MEHRNRDKQRDIFLPRKDRNLGFMVFEQYEIQTVFLEREVNYEVRRGGDYLFRLVPGMDGFEISKLDRALGSDIDLLLAERIAQHILVSQA
jgi:hypothetical protein